MVRIMFNLIPLVVLISMVGICSGVTFGTCLVPNSMEDFEPQLFFKGVWYKQKLFGVPVIFENLIGTCPAVEYTITPNNQIEEVDSLFNPLVQRYIEKRGRSVLSFNGQNYYRFIYSIMGGIVETEYNMHVIQTNYDDYAIVYYCRPLFFLKIEAAWIMTRSRSGIIDPAQMETIREKLLSAGLVYNRFQPEKNTNCNPIETHFS